MFYGCEVRNKIDKPEEFSLFLGRIWTSPYKSKDKVRLRHLSKILILLLVSHKTCQSIFEDYSLLLDSVS